MNSRQNKEYSFMKDVLFHEPNSDTIKLLEERYKLKVKAYDYDVRSKTLNVVFAKSKRKYSLVASLNIPEIHQIT